MKLLPFNVTIIPSRPGKICVAFKCPCCGVRVLAYLWSLSGSGKRCVCGAKHTRGGTIIDKETDHETKPDQAHTLSEMSRAAPAKGNRRAESPVLPADGLRSRRCQTAGDRVLAREEESRMNQIDVTKLDAWLQAITRVYRAARMLCVITKKEEEPADAEVDEAFECLHAAVDEAEKLLVSDAPENT